MDGVYTVTVAGPGAPVNVPGTGQADDCVQPCLNQTCPEGDGSGGEVVASAVMSPIPDRGPVRAQYQCGVMSETGPLNSLVAPS